MSKIFTNASILDRSKRAGSAIACILCLCAAPALAQNELTPMPNTTQAMQATPQQQYSPETQIRQQPMPSIDELLQEPDIDDVEAPETGLFVADPSVPQLTDTTLLATADAKRRVRDGSVMPEAMTTLFFTAWQHALLQEAKIGFNTRLPDGSRPTGEEVAKPSGPREISLGGIAFYNSSKWTIWLNSERVTPNAIPQQILDIKVNQAYIDLKWFDNGSNKIYPIRLRPQERFNLDTRIFLPGTGLADSAM